MKNTGSIKRGFKKIFYEARGIKAKTLVSLMLAGGIALSAAYTGKLLYCEYASSRAEVDLYYNEIAKAQYPDKSRFTYYDFVDADKIAEALEIIQQRGIYENFTPEELQKKFYIYSKLDSSVREMVDYARSEGQNYSYVANEYAISFFQPHDYKDKNIFNRFFGKDYSKEFLEILMEVNYRHFVNDLGGAGGFRRLTETGDLSKYDFEEKASMYDMRINSVIDTLNALDKTSDNFVSPTQNRSLKDIVGEYRILSADLDTIVNFITSSGITKDLEVTKTKRNTNIEPTLLSYNKSNDLYNINLFAQNAYDHTFTENLIVVALDESDGLYQARPKTAFDTVVEQKHDAMEDAANYMSKLNELNTASAKYTATTLSEEDYARLSEKCIELQTAFDEAYTALSEKAARVVEEFYSSSNNGFMHYKVEKRSLFGMSFLSRFVIMFILGAVCAFIACVCVNSCREYEKARKRRKIVEELRKEA